jgi:hypothetical protein
VPPWRAGTPDEQGWYIVAILYKGGMGTIGCATWSKSHGWSLIDEHIVAYISVDTLLTSAKIEWPEHLTPS